MQDHILVVDCGSTGIRSVLLKADGKISRRYYKKLEVLHPEPGATENDPEFIWSVFKDVVKKGIDTPLTHISAIAITNQRSTFALWDKSGTPLTNFINWQDIRAADTVRAMNRHPLWVSLRTVAFFIGRLLRNPLLTVTSMLRLNTDHSICKLRWVLDKEPDILNKCKSDDVYFGTIDTWLLYRLTGKKNHVTDYTNAAATTMLNPFMMKWNSLFCKIFKIPMNILPVVLNTNDHFGNTDAKLFGKSIPVTAVVGDQQASLFGHRCFNPGDMKITLGSGAFISMNVGKKPMFSTKGLFPLIGWKTTDSLNYILEGQVATVGTFIDWLVHKMELFKTPQELDKVAATSIKEITNFCTPTLSGLRFPYFKPDMKASFHGLSLETDRADFAKSIIDGIAHRVVDIIDGMETETKLPIKYLKVDGGVSNSDILCQRISDLSGKPLNRSSESDLASMGAGYLAGLSIGVWKSKDEILQIKIPNRSFTPIIDNETRKRQRNNWKTHIRDMEKLHKH